MSNQQDQEYIITKIFNLTDPIMLQELAHMYKYKFHNKPEIKKIIIQYAVSSYTEPECFPQKTPISSIPEIIDSNQLFIHNFIIINNILVWFCVRSRGPSSYSQVVGSVESPF